MMPWDEWLLMYQFFLQLYQFKNSNIVYLINRFANLTVADWNFKKSEAELLFKAEQLRDWMEPENHC